MRKLSIKEQARILKIEQLEIKMIKDYIPVSEIEKELNAQYDLYDSDKQTETSFDIMYKLEDILLKHNAKAFETKKEIEQNVKKLQEEIYLYNEIIQDSYNYNEYFTKQDGEERRKDVNNSKEFAVNRLNMYKKILREW